MRDAAVLIFADPLSLELARKGIARRHGRQFDLPDLTGVDADVVIDGGHGNTFAERLKSALSNVRHYRRVVIVGRDCPTRSAADVAQALGLLNSREMVLGPDGRGGCWLIGLRGDRLDCLEGICWRRGEDFEALRDRVPNAAVLVTKADIDGSGDLPQSTPIVVAVRVHVAPQHTAHHWQTPPPVAA